jgi:hypothetical protein
VESLGARVGRHLTNQRTDAVAMKVLDPFEVAYVKLWPFHISGLSKKRKKRVLNRAEYTVYRHVLRESKLKAVLNEVQPPVAETIDLPEAIEGRIVPDAVLKSRRHPDVRIARRAATIADLAKVVSEREVSKGLRRTLCAQARRLLDLAERRFADVSAIQRAADSSREETD